MNNFCAQRGPPWNACGDHRRQAGVAVSGPKSTKLVSSAGVAVSGFEKERVPASAWGRSRVRCGKPMFALVLSVRGPEENQLVSSADVAVSGAEKGRDTFRSGNDGVACQCGPIRSTKRWKPFGNRLIRSRISWKPLALVREFVLIHF